MVTARGRGRYQNENKKKRVKSMEKRNVDTKGKSPKQGLTNTKELNSDGDANFSTIN